MLVIRFPNLAAVRSALVENAVPSAISRGPARVGFDADGQVWLQPKTPFPNRSVNTLSKYGASIQSESPIDLTETVGSWLELVPLAQIAVEPDNRPSRVLVDLHDASGLPALVAEVRRLGAGNIGVRWLDTNFPGRKAGSRALLLVDSPPYHSIISGDSHVFAEQAPRIWVEVGWRYPLAETIDLPKNKIVLIRAPRIWEFISDGPFQPGPDKFLLSEQPTAPEVVADIQLPITVQLVADRADELPELWVLHDRPVDQLRAIARQTDDRLLARLSVAVGVADGQQIAVLRTNPRRGGPPVLVLDALPCRPHLRLPNLYLPVGQTLRPPLRRDAIRRLFAPDEGTVVWLEKDESGEIIANELPEVAFRPLNEAIAYVQDRETQSLTPRVMDQLFSLPTFVVRDLVARPTRRDSSHPVSAPSISPPVAEQPGVLSRIVRWFSPRSGEPAVHGPTVESPPAGEPPRSLDAGEDQRRLLEERLLVALNAPDGPERAALWPELAHLYAAMSRPGDAAICWLNALWETDAPPPQWSRGWLRAEADQLRGRPASRAAVSDADLRRWLREPPTPAAVRTIAAAVNRIPIAPALTESLDRVQQMLSEHEDWVPVRTAWLARLGLTRLNGDLVDLARTRDRLLERLRVRGLSADQDVPAAVRFAGQGAGERVDAVRVWLTKARAPIQQWLDSPPAGASTEGSDARLQAFGMGTAAGPTRVYADLILAWGLARLGERVTSHDLLEQARGMLYPLDAAHKFLLEAFAARIEQALEGRIGGPLPGNILASLADLRERDPMLAFKVDRLRQFSHILEPTEQVWAFTESWLDPQVDGPNRDLAGLRYVTDRDELADRLLPVVASAGGEPGRLPVVLAAALDLAPRLGESLAVTILERLLSAADDWSFAGPTEQVASEVTAIERGLFVAAHFDRAQAVRRMVAHFDRLLDVRGGSESSENRPIEDALLALVGQGLRVLRRLGLREEADRLLNRLGTWVAPGGNMAAERRKPTWPRTLRRMLTLAGGWFYVGRDAAATEVLDEARRLLYSPTLTIEAHRRQQADLACAYAVALGQAPVRLALKGVEELFVRLPALSDNLVTNTHFSLAKLRLVEAAIRAVVTDDFALGPAVRRWLDDDEYRVRRRIHRDTRAVIGSTG